MSSIDDLHAGRLDLSREVPLDPGPPRLLMTVRPKPPLRPVRKVVSRAPRRPVGWFASRRMQCLLPWESLIELDFLFLAETDQTVQAMYAQPAKVWYCLDGWKSTVPDFRLDRADGVEFIEAKTDRDAADPENTRRFRAIGATLAAQGFAYTVARASAIRREPRLANAKLLMRYSAATVGPRFQLDLMAMLTTGPMMVGQAEERLGGRAVARPSLFAAVLDGLLALNLEEPIGPDSVLHFGRRAAP